MQWREMCCTAWRAVLNGTQTHSGKGQRSTTLCDGRVELAAEDALLRDPKCVDPELLALPRVRLSVKTVIHM
jgi:hypothetical protein